MAAELSERQRRRYEKMTVKLQGKGVLEPDEQVLLTMNNVTVPAWVYMLIGGGLLLLPYQLQKSSYAVLTEKHVYVIKAIGRRVLLKAPLGEITASVEGKAFPGRCLVIGDQKLWMPLLKKYRMRGYAIAVAASRQPIADGAAAAGDGAAAAGDGAPTAPEGSGTPAGAGVEDADPTG